VILGYIVDPLVGPYSRIKRRTLEEKAKHEKDWENTVPYDSTKKGKQFVVIMIFISLWINRNK